MSKRPGFATMFAIAAVVAVCIGCGNNAPAAREHTRTFLAMDTVVVLTAVGDNAEAALSAAETRLRELESMADMHRADSDIGKLNAAAGLAAVPLHPEIYRILTIAQEYYRRTDGAWDVTVAPLTTLWQERTEGGELPTDEEIEQAQALVGGDKMVLDAERQTAYLPLAGMAVDLGGIAKGYALDEVRHIYENYGIESGLINLGSSSVCAVGQHNDRPWRIGIRNPRAATDEPARVISLTSATLATSGSYERGREINGEWYHHIINPHTGYPAAVNCTSVTVIVGNDDPNAGMAADALATAAFIVGHEQIAPLLAEYKAEIVTVEKN